MRPVQSEAVRRSAPAAKATGQSQARPARAPGAQLRGQSKTYQGGPEAPFTSAVFEVTNNREVLRAARYECSQMNHLGEEKWRSSSRTALLLPSGQWALYVTKTGRRVSEGHGHGALERAIGDRTLGADLRELVRPERIDSGGDT